MGNVYFKRGTLSSLISASKNSNTIYVSTDIPSIWLGSERLDSSIKKLSVILGGSATSISEREDSTDAYTDSHPTTENSGLFMNLLQNNGSSNSVYGSILLYGDSYVNLYATTGNGDSTNAGLIPDISIGYKLNTDNIRNNIIKPEITSAITTVNSSISNINATLSNKVDKETGKGLSTNDYTTAEKNKLSGISEGATKITVDSALSSTSSNPVQNKIIYNNINDLSGYRSLSNNILYGDADYVISSIDLTTKTTGSGYLILSPLHKTLSQSSNGIYSLIDSSISNIDQSYANLLRVGTRVITQNANSSSQYRHVGTVISAWTQTIDGSTVTPSYGRYLVAIGSNNTNSTSVCNLVLISGYTTTSSRHQYKYQIFNLFDLVTLASRVTNLEDDVSTLQGNVESLMS